jgi:hypothetical protein
VSGALVLQGDVRAALARPFAAEQVRWRRGSHGKEVAYVTAQAVIGRLNEALAAWDFTIERYEVGAEEVVVLGRLVADGVTKMAFGGATRTRTAAGALGPLADDLKAAASDALKKAASLLGVGLEFYGGQAVPAQGPSGPHTELSLSERQAAAVRALFGRRNVSPERAAEILRRRFGKARIEELTAKEASALLDEQARSPR